MAKDLLSGIVFVLSLFILTVCCYHVTCAFLSKFTLYSCRNVKELHARKRRNNWSSNDCNETRTHYYFVRKWKLNHLANLATWLSCVASTYLCSAFNCVIIMSRARFKVNPPSIVTLMSRNSLLETGAISEV